ncbi:tRNA nucleotidyltransferase, CC-adding [uncultured Synechococcales cyanobacterium]|uniref:tRNA nucleotidyltransferase, CC-adding n=1 Tax=uncultured Synechococcales cyanobacterium TaxID=1936017 RepID=A0A6J4VI05_9CYAN|nr:tRNA nucleotidyltransferase, CC-adding [uncultured Synechococcales cyanobacterium]
MIQTKFFGISSIHLQFSPDTWPFSLEQLPQPSYVVGGWVRDTLRGHAASYLDLDFVLPASAVEIASAIACAYSAGFVLLDPERQIARVVFEQGTADFALQVGSSLTTDLQRRDFTVNAIAYNPHTQTITDPLQGCADLEQGVIRMISAENLAADPLRLLRAYRQAAQLHFRLEPTTQRTIRQLAPCLQQVAAERVRVELGYLLASEAGTVWLEAAWQDGLLDYWLPEASAAGIAQINEWDSVATLLLQTWPDLKIPLLSPVSQRSKSGDSNCPTLLATAKLTGLVSPNPAQAASNLLRLKYSRAEINLVTLLLQLLPQVQSIKALAVLSRREQYFLFQKAGPAFPVLAIMAISQGTPIQAIAPFIERYLTPNDAIAHPMPLISGKDLINKLHLRPGPQIGQLLSTLEIAQAEGNVSTPEEALALARELI